jgi:hypothetical protein
VSMARSVLRSVSNCRQELNSSTTPVIVKIDSFIRFVFSAAHALPVFEDLGFSACAMLLHSALTSRVILVLSLGAIHNHSLGPFGKPVFL